MDLETLKIFSSQKCLLQLKSDKAHPLSWGWVPQTRRVKTTEIDSFTIQGARNQGVSQFGSFWSSWGRNCCQLLLRLLVVADNPGVSLACRPIALSSASVFTEPPYVFLCLWPVFLHSGQQLWVRPHPKPVMSLSVDHICKDRISKLDDYHRYQGQGLSPLTFRGSQFNPHRCLWLFLTQ